MPATALIFDVQRFSVHDGPGLRTTVFLKGCPLRCAWCQNPESFLAEPEIAFHADRCSASGECLGACTRGALVAGPTAGRVDRDRCDACGECVDACAFAALEVIGREVTVGALLDEVLRDRPFFESSGGGVTLSGGEPTRWMPFVGELARACRAHGVSVGLQTCGAFRWATLAPHLPLFEFVHFDLKVMDDRLHRQHTGAGNRTILENARRLVEAGAPVQFRTPVVPGYTDTPDNLAAIGDLLDDLGVGALSLLRYHSLGEAKLARLGTPVPPLSLGPEARGPGPLERAAAALGARGLEVTT